MVRRLLFIVTLPLAITAWLVLTILGGAASALVWIATGEDPGLALAGTVVVGEFWSWCRYGR